MSVSPRRSLSVCVYACLGAAVFAHGPLAAGQRFTSADVTPEVAASALQLARNAVAATLSGDPIDLEAVPGSERLQAVDNGAHVVLIQESRVVGNAHADQASLAGNLCVATRRAVRLTDLKHPEATVLVLTIFLEEKPFDKPPLAALLSRAAALGLHGMRAEFRGLKRFTPPVDPLLHGRDWHEALLDLAGRLSPPPPDADPESHEERQRLLKDVLMNPGFRLTLVEGLTLAGLPGRSEPVRLYRMSRLVPLASVSSARIQEALDLARQWYAANQKENGLFPYLYDPLADKEIPERHLQRETLNAAALGTLWRHTQIEAVRAMGLKALERLFAEHYLEDPDRGFGYLREPNRPATLGGAAAGLYAILELRADKAKASFRKQAEKLARFLQALRREDGRFALQWPEDVESPRIDYHPGQAQLALMGWARLTEDADLVRACLKSMQYYQGYFRETLEQRKHPPYPMIPWHTQACYKLYAASRREAVADFIFNMNRLLVGIQEVMPRKGEFLPADARGRFVRPRKRAMGRPHVTATAVYLEGLADAFALARALEEEALARQFRRALVWGARCLLQHQIRDEVETLLVPNPARALGGFRTRPTDPVIRIDNMQHAVCALAKIDAVLKEADYAAVHAEEQGRAKP